MFDDYPSYYAIIPAPVRYDKRLTDKQKLLYGEITALANKEGFCYATNGYFAKLYECTEQTISASISNLQKCGYLFIEISECYQRKIYITTHQKNLKGVSEKSEGGIKKILRGVSKKSEDNITSINNTVNTTVNIKENIIKEKSKKVFSDDGMEVIKLYEERFGMVSTYKATQLDDLVEDFGKDVVAYAVRQANISSAPAITYIRNVAMNEKRRRDNGTGNTARVSESNPGEPMYGQGIVV